ncbi:Gamma-glutamyl phosphate reductase [Caprobacter fermentans]|uniref:Gamma-glutamyl phosphate reductase n=1 Tax=Caproicibacter fermentans TaxID=2576756 RepID=A0A6N8I2K9_9FIRM|nr:glutamate-5-semialdehyde dehydrogenase [Caproicibacter fermentans]MVB12135.1 Gamma-glutamyl phosphate reductase [Caproicibacter fermentans]OCN01213.1 glutamate-5-semialdehyde dehydrogenase [Clostridium sp. W14A]
MTALQEMGRRAKAAARELAAAGELRQKALFAMAGAVEDSKQEILSANRLDLDQAERDGMSAPLMDRLALSPDRVRGMADGIRSVAAQADPVGQVVSGFLRPNGLKIEKVRVPIGVIGMIYEARPNVTADAAALCLKAGNAVILRGGKEALRSNEAIAGAMRGALEACGLNPDCVQLVGDTSRASAVEMMRLTGYLDVLIPRGGQGLIRSVVENSRVPVIQTGAGNCHVYVDNSADVGMAAEIIFNAKTSRPSVCNAIETILVHREIAQRALPAIQKRLDEKHVELRGCERTRAILGDGVVPATEDDWAAEYLDYILAVRVVDSMDEAIRHIARYSTGHSEVIVTDSYENARRFTAAVDAAAVYVNASTRFTDGGEFGLGAEIGISTQKLHARGPMGAFELTSYKFIVTGSGQIR